jgi:hypothetical protein
MARGPTRVVLFVVLRFAFLSPLALLAYSLPWLVQSSSQNLVHPISMAYL